MASRPQDPATRPESGHAVAEGAPGPADGAGPAQGLVTCATTVRVSETAGEPGAATGGRRFPTTELVAAAAGLWDRRESWGGAVAPVPGAAALAGLRPATGRRRRVGEEGPRPTFSIAPGAVAVSWPDVARAERTAERGQEADRKRISEDARDFNRRGGEFAPDPEPTRVITEWSAKSRSRMTRTLAELDYGPLLRLALRLPMTTLTYPGDWLLVAPTGKAVKAHLTTWQKRFERAWGFRPLGIWKLEFQRRGAPHLHIWGPEPEGTAGELRRLTSARYRPAVGDGLPYREWLSAVWTDIVFADAEADLARAAKEAGTDQERAEVAERWLHVVEQRRRHGLAGTGVDFGEGERMRDPRRLAVYFTKHGSFKAKDYQNRVPDSWAEPCTGPGRFWGYWGLQSAAVAVEIDPAAAVWAARILRRYARAQGVTQQVTVWRRKGGQPQLGDDAREVVGLAGAEFVAGYAEPRARRRKVRRRAVRLRGGRGFLCVNDGPALASQLERAVRALELDPTKPRLRRVQDVGVVNRATGEVLEDVAAADDVPTCTRCDGPLDPRMAGTESSGPPS